MERNYKDTLGKECMTTLDNHGGRSTFAFVETMCKLTERDARQFNARFEVREKGQKDFPWQSTLSDHKLRRAYIHGFGHVETWNVLNEYYVEWMSAQLHETEGGRMEDLSQRLTHLNFGSLENKLERQRRIAEHIAIAVLDGVVVCAQEMTEEQHKLIVECFETSKKKDSASRLYTLLSDDDRFKRVDGRAKHNFNCTYADHARFAVEMFSAVPAPDMGVDEGLIRFAKLRNRAMSSASMAVNVVNVHIGYGKNKAYSEFFRNVFPSEPTIVAGDFNCSARWPPRTIKAAERILRPDVDGDHMSAWYKHPAFVFFFDPEMPHYSAVNRAENVVLTDEDKAAGVTRAEGMLDSFDYIMGVNFFTQEALEAIQLNQE